MRAAPYQESASDSGCQTVGLHAARELGNLVVVGGWELQVVDHAARNAGMKQDDQAELLGLLVQRKVRRVVVIASWIDDLEALEPAFRELADVRRGGLVDAEHGEGHDQLRVAFGGLFDVVVAFARTAEETHAVDVEPLAVVREHVEHAFGRVDGQF